MCKKDQLLEYSIQDIVDMISTDQNIEYDEAMNKFYNSEVFEKLVDKETGLYLESPEYVYDLFKDEMNQISCECGSLLIVSVSAWYCCFYNLMLGNSVSWGMSLMICIMDKLHREIKVNIGTEI